MARILVVDDSLANRETMARVLEAAGYAVATAADGADAVALARRDPPDLVLMDLGMPELDGWEATRQLKDDPLTVHVPVLVVSAYTRPGDRERALLAGCDGHHPKPADLPTLLEHIELLLAGGQ